MKTKKSIKKKPTPDSYLKFLKGAALQGIGLDAAQIKVDRYGLADVTNKGLNLPLSLDANFKVLLQTHERLIVGAEFEVKQARRDGDEIRAGLLTIGCAFSAVFNLTVPCEGETANQFANTEAKLIFWPYLRQFIADMSYQTAIAPILLPLMTAGASFPNEK